MGLLALLTLVVTALAVPVAAAPAGSTPGAPETGGTQSGPGGAGAGQGRPAAVPGQAGKEAPAETAGPALAIGSPSAVLMEARSGRILFAKNPHERRNPASVTKIMTLLVAYDALAAGKAAWDDPVTTSAEAKSQGGTQVFLEVGEVNPLGALLKAISVGSANDAAVAVAEHLGGSHEGFVALMNDRARGLGLQNTQFQNATGFDAPGHYSTAYDIAVIARELILRHPQALRHSKIFYELFQHPDGRETEMLNRNRLVHFHNWVDGLKTGHTQASGYSIAATGERGGTRMIAVILGAPNADTRQADALRLLEYGLARFTTVTHAPPGQPLAAVPVLRGMRRQVAAVPRVPVAVTVPREDREKVEWKVQVAPRLQAPVTRGQVIGRVTAVVGGREEAAYELVAAENVPRLTLWAAFRRAFSRLLGSESD
ncbi:MAG: D-alanyl-D-alanine carboxypeptidase family protein [Bacillota bacterium]